MIPAVKAYNRPNKTGVMSDFRKSQDRTAPKGSLSPDIRVQINANLKFFFEKQIGKKIEIPSGIL